MVDEVSKPPSTSQRYLDMRLRLQTFVEIECNGELWLEKGKESNVQRMKTARVIPLDGKPLEDRKKKFRTFLYCCG